MIGITRTASLALIGSLVLASSVAAQTEGPNTPAPATQAEKPRTQVNIGRAEPQGSEGRDLRLLNTAMGAVQRSGFSGLRRHVRALKQALDHAPATYPLVEQTPARWIVRSDDFSQVMMVGLMASASGAPSIDVVQQSNVYGTIALVLTSEAVERHAYAEAIGYADQGLALQPQNAMLVSEKASALLGLGRFDEMLATVDAALPDVGLLSGTDRALLQRRRGSALIELGRLDEAKRAFEDSLVSEPGNAAAANELQYIEGLKAGRPGGPLTLTTVPRSTTDQ
ncbi:MAG TPA: hypothetical protein VF633_12785 [Brevundimonas sp.]|jgi:tetratricopeptide (TPR) repeat protein